jgi:synaptobrevin homolog YKT6
MCITGEVLNNWRVSLYCFVVRCYACTECSHAPRYEGVIICDQEYPVRPAFSLLTKLLDEFTAKIPQSLFGNPSAIDFPEVTSFLQKYQDPRQADAIMKVQQELDETKIVLVSFCLSSELHRCHPHRYTLQHKTIESVLQRGEKINDLVDRSQALSAQSKMFYKTAKKVRSSHLWMTCI